MKKHIPAGFTLVELMITVVIIGILVGIAYPGYKKWLVQTRRSEAQNALLLAASQQEKFFTECNFYAAKLVGTRACGTAGAASSILGFPLILNGNPIYQYYTISDPVAGNISGNYCTPTSTPAGTFNCGYTITATPITSGQQAGDGPFRIDALGNKQWDKANNGTFNSQWTGQ